MKKFIVKSSPSGHEILELDEDGNAEPIAHIAYEKSGTAVEIRDAVNYCRAQRAAKNRRQDGGDADG